MFTTFFKKKQDNSDVFKKLIHRLSDMSVQDLEKIDRLLDIIFTPDQGSEQLKTEATYREETLDDTLKEAKNQLHKEQLEKNLERFRKNSQIMHQKWCIYFSKCYNGGIKIKGVCHDWKEHKILT